MSACGDIAAVALWALWADAQRCPQAHQRPKALRYLASAGNSEPSLPRKRHKRHIDHSLATVCSNLWPLCVDAQRLAQLSGGSWPRELATIGHNLSVHVRVFESSKARPFDLCVRIKD